MAVPTPPVEELATAVHSNVSISVSDEGLRTSFVPGSSVVFTETFCKEWGSSNRFLEFLRQKAKIATGWGCSSMGPGALASQIDGIFSPDYECIHVPWLQVIIQFLESYVQVIDLDTRSSSYMCTLSFSRSTNAELRGPMFKGVSDIFYSDGCMGFLSCSDDGTATTRFIAVNLKKKFIRCFEAVIHHGDTARDVYCPTKFVLVAEKFMLCGHTHPLSRHVTVFRFPKNFSDLFSSEIAETEEIRCGTLQLSSSQLSTPPFVWKSYSGCGTSSSGKDFLFVFDRSKVYVHDLSRGDAFAPDAVVYSGDLPSTFSFKRYGSMFLIVGSNVRSLPRGCFTLVSYSPDSTKTGGNVIFRPYLIDSSVERNVAEVFPRSVDVSVEGLSALYSSMHLSRFRFFIHSTGVVFRNKANRMIVLHNFSTRDDERYTRFQKHYFRNLICIISRINPRLSIESLIMRYLCRFVALSWTYTGCKAW